MSSVVCKQRPLRENEQNISENSIAMTLTQTIFRKPLQSSANTMEISTLKPAVIF